MSSWTESFTNHRFRKGNAILDEKHTAGRTALEKARDEFWATWRELAQREGKREARKKEEETGHESNEENE